MPPSRQDEPVRHAERRPSPIAGNGLFATRAVAAGAPVAVLPRPLVAVLDGGRLEDTCANCFGWTADEDFGPRAGGGGGEVGEVKACAGCRVYRYCGKKCQSEAWKRSHKYECAAIKLDPRRGTPLPNLARAGIQLLLLRLNGRIADAQWSAIMALPSYMDLVLKPGDHLAPLHDRLEPLMALDPSIRDTFDQVKLVGASILRFAGGVTPAAAALAPALGVELAGRLFLNSLTLTSPPLDPLGLVFDPFLAAANHSCAPTAFVALDGPAAHLRAARPLPPGAELTLAYADPSEPRHRRRALLLRRYHFLCACSRCAAAAAAGPADPADAWRVPPAAMPPAAAADADALLAARRPAAAAAAEWAVFGPDLRAAVAGPDADDRALRRALALETEAYARVDAARGAARSDDADDDDDALAVLRGAVALCERAGLWARTRQPVPAAEQEMVTREIGRGAFGAALVRAVRLFWRVEPVLHAGCEFHPVRVVGGWRVVKLAVYLAGEEGGGDEVARFEGKGVDFGVLAAGVLEWVVRMCGRSHGEGSRFAVRVGEKAVEMCGGGVGVEEARVMLGKVPGVEGLEGMLDRIADIEV
ncbi:hypothetical protein BDY21DRAFT_377338 [Lineolata rhizophorae]|uniref:MYND-type domain-containing protein n=1 Tax=Lineolata rhizophorae TaxID=578093 RepID=A0A6A6P6T7_9PEZI|nr:hypothetical protein BDY21DRAFT_377338 [Lineolata rhizophorae]